MISPKSFYFLLADYLTMVHDHRQHFALRSSFLFLSSNDFHVFLRNILGESPVLELLLVLSDTVRLSRMPSNIEVTRQVLTRYRPCIRVMLVFHDLYDFLQFHTPIEPFKAILVRDLSTRLWVRWLMRGEGRHDGNNGCVCVCVKSRYNTCSVRLLEQERIEYQDAQTLIYMFCSARLWGNSFAFMQPHAESGDWRKSSFRIGKGIREQDFLRFKTTNLKAWQKFQTLL